MRVFGFGALLSVAAILGASGKSPASLARKNLDSLSTQSLRMKLSDPRNYAPSVIDKEATDAKQIEKFDLKINKGLQNLMDKAAKGEIKLDEVTLKKMKGLQASGKAFLKSFREKGTREERREHLRKVLKTSDDLLDNHLVKKSEPYLLVVEIYNSGLDIWLQVENPKEKKKD